jgi:thymidine kinase
MAEFINTVGAMGSGKTLEAMRMRYNLARRHFGVVACKSPVDTKAEARIETRFKGKIQEEVDFLLDPSDNAITRVHEIARKLHPQTTRLALICDEAQFITPSQAEQFRELTDEYGVSVYSYGIETDFLRHFFPGSLRLRELADDTIWLPSICDGYLSGECSAQARFNTRLIHGKFTFVGEQTAIDEEGSAPTERPLTTYRALCGACYHMAELDASRGNVAQMITG